MNGFRVCCCVTVRVARTATHWVSDAAGIRGKAACGRSPVRTTGLGWRTCSNVPVTCKSCLGIAEMRAAQEQQQQTTPAGAVLPVGAAAGDARPAYETGAVMSERATYWVETEDGGVRPATLDEWCGIFTDTQGRPCLPVVAADEEGDRSVRTFFRGLPMGIGTFIDPNAAPLLYETMTCDGESIEDGERYCTRDQAMAGHARACLKHLGRLPAMASKTEAPG